MKTVTEKIVLSIESAIQGGSISLLKGQNEIDFWVGTKSVSRSEDLLREISVLLNRNNINKTDIEMIAVSDSIGSQTGIRIGLSTSLGLGKVLNCEVKRIQTLAAMASFVKIEGRYGVAVSTNNQHITFQTFVHNRNNGNRQKISLETFFELIEEKFLNKIIVNECFYNFIVENKTKILKKDISNYFINAGQNLAKLIGTRAYFEYASDNKKVNPI